MKSKKQVTIIVISYTIEIRQINGIRLLILTPFSASSLPDNLFRRPLAVLKPDYINGVRDHQGILS